LAKHIPRAMFHMLPRDVEIWRRFLSKYEDDFDEFKYDVLCGPKLRLEDPDLDWLGDFSERALSLRIDVLGFKEDEVWLIEVKPTLRTVVVTDYCRHYMPELDEAFEIERIIV